MKVNVFGLLAICAVFNFAFLSAADDVNAEISTTTLSTPLNETTVTKSAEIENLSAENASVEGSKPPRLFPIDDEKIVPKNDTALKILQEISSKSSEDPKNLTEITLSIDSINTTALPSSSEASVNSTNVETPEDDYDNLSDENEKSDSENIQDNSDKQTEDELEEEFSKTGSSQAKINMFEDPVTEPRIHGGHLALIFASALIVFSVLAYVGLVLWRSRLESRYGLSQRLVTEDDYYNNNDVRYFGL